MVTVSRLEPETFPRLNISATSFRHKVRFHVLKLCHDSLCEQITIIIWKAMVMQANRKNVPGILTNITRKQNITRHYISWTTLSAAQAVLSSIWQKDLEVLSQSSPTETGENHVQLQSGRNSNRPTSKKRYCLFNFARSPQFNRLKSVLIIAPTICAHVNFF
jgi:hypothetical protein